MEKENEVSPIQEDKSYVDEFLANCVYIKKLDITNNYSPVLCKEFLDRYVTNVWFQRFCKELEILREMSKIVNNQVEYLKNKHKQ